MSEEIEDPVDGLPVGTKKSARKRSRKGLFQQDDSPEVVNKSKFLPDYDTEEVPPSFRERVFEVLADIRVRIILGVLILSALVWAVIPPVYSLLKIWRARDLTHQSSVAWDQGDESGALMLMRRAVLMAPQDEDIFRRARLLNARIGDPSCIKTLEILAHKNEANTDELIALAGQAIKVGNLKTARAAFTKITGKRTVEMTILEMQILAMGKKIPDAIALAKKSLPEFNMADAEKLRLALAALIWNADPRAAEAILTPLAASPSASGIASLRLLAKLQLDRAMPSNSSTTGLGDRLASHPLHNASDALLVADLRIKENPARSQAVIEELRRVRATGNPDEEIEFARWLNRRGAHHEVIDFIGKERALSSSTWLLIYLDALAAMNRWSEIFALLDSDSLVGLSETIRCLFLAHSAEKTGDKARAEEAWREMHRNLLYEKPEGALFIAAYAMKSGNDKEGIKAFWTLARRPDTAMQGFIGLIRFTPKGASASELLPVYSEMLETFPNLQDARSDYAYLCLLSGNNVEEAVAVSREIFNKEPNSLAALSVAALAYYKSGEISQAASLYDGKLIAWKTAPAQWKAIRVAVLVALGRNKEAADLAATIDVTNLRPEERKLLEQPDPSVGSGKGAFRSYIRNNDLCAL